MRSFALRSLAGPLAAVLAALSLVGAATAQEPARVPGPPGPRLYLTGKATIEATPDFAVVLIGVVTRAPTTAGAIDGTSASAAKIIEVAKGAGIEARDIQTGYVSLQPAYRTVRDSSSSSEQRPDGYQATNQVTIRIRNLGRLGEVLRAVVDSGANRIGGVDFQLAEPGKLETRALTGAVQDARRQAETIAAAAGVRLGRIEEIRYGERAAPPAPVYRARAAAAPSAPPPVPVEAGSLEVSAEVQVVFALEPS